MTESTPLPEATAPMSAAQRDQLYRQVRTSLGEPGRTYVELTDAVLDTQLELATEDYSAMIYDWLISQQWGNLQGQEVNTTNFVLAFANRSLDYVQQFTAAYGKQTGIGSQAPWELKKDCVEIIPGQQVYQLPAGREINEVLWQTPPSLSGGTGTPGSLPWLAQANGWLYGNQTAGAVLPTYSTMLYAQDRLQRNRVSLSEHSYKVTAGPNGTKNLHLYPVPGGRFEIPGPEGRHGTGSLVWYWYYDTNPKNRDACLADNEDVIHLPDQVPLQLMSWGKMNLISRTRVRKLLVRNAVNYVALVRGLFKGEMPSPSADKPTITVDYQMLLAMGKELGDSVLKEVMDSLEKISSLTVLRRQADEAEAINRTIRYQPPKTPFIFR
jgi:hypothetical protein